MLRSGVFRPTLCSGRLSSPGNWQLLLQSSTVLGQGIEVEDVGSCIGLDQERSKYVGLFAWRGSGLGGPRWIARMSTAIYALGVHQIGVVNLDAVQQKLLLQGSDELGWFDD